MTGAIYHFSLAQKGASNGGVVASAAYRHAAQMKNERTGETKNYSGKQNELIHSEISVPQDAPDWAKERYTAFVGDNPEARADVAKVSERLWNDVEAANVRLNRRPDKAPRFAASYDMALPLALTKEENIKLMQEFVANHITSRGMIADWVYHDLPHNPHVHMLTTVRELGEDDWGQLRRDWRGPSFLRGLRMAWAQEVNAGLARAGLDLRVDHRSYRDQGLEIKPSTINVRRTKNVENGGKPSYERENAEIAKAKNEALLKEKPEHILQIVGAKKTVFTRDEVSEELASRVNLGPEDFEDLLERAMSSVELVKLSVAASDGSDQFSTRARIDREGRFMAQSVAMAADRLEGVSGAEKIELLSENLRDSQRGAAKAMLSSERLSLVTGYAGTGKTYTVAEVAKVWRARGYEVLGGAASGKATQELTGIRGLTAASLASWDAQWARGRRPASGKFVFIMDEAGMVGTDTWARMQAQVDAMGGKFIALGDPEQLQPVGDVTPFYPLQDEIGVSVMDQIVRQNNPLEREATRMFALGGAHVSAGLGYYAKHGGINWAQNDLIAEKAVVENYVAAPSSLDQKVMLGLSNVDVWSLNDRARAELFKKGVIDTTDAVNGGLITRVHRKGGMARSFNVPLEIAKGERLLFTSAMREHKIPKSSLGTVVNIQPQARTMDILVDGFDKPVTVDLRAFNNFDYGYAVTAHKAQGMSVDNAYVLAHSHMSRHWAYVAMSRHKESVELHVSRERIDTYQALEKIVTRSGVFDLRKEPQADQALGRVGQGVEALSDVYERPDYVAPTRPAPQVPGSMLSDSQLSLVMNKTAGLLSAEWSEGSEPFVGDTRDYGNHPMRAIEDLSASQSVFSAAEVAGKLSEVVRDPDSFIRLFGEVMSAPDLVILSEDGPLNSGRLYTTASQLRLEADVIDRGVRLHMEGYDRSEEEIYQAKAHGESSLSSKLSAKYNLTKDQGDALVRVSNRRGLTILSGGSGTGKTRLAACLEDRFAAMSKKAIVVGPTGRAVENLRIEGAKNVVTLNQLLGRAQGGRLDLAPDSMIILDEAGLVGAKDADRLFDLAERGQFNIVMMRDTDQVSPYSAGPIADMLAQRIGSHSLDRSIRHANALTGSAVSYLGTASDKYNAPVYWKKACNDLHSLDVIKGAGSRVGALDELARAYVADPNQSKLALTHSGRDATELNEKIRALLDERLPERAAWLEAQEHPFDAGSLSDLCVGDRIELTERNASLGLRVGTPALVVARDTRGLVLQLGAEQEDRFLRVDPNEAELSYRFTFASTVHGSKGRSVDSVHIYGAPSMSREVLHTGLGLHRNELNIVLPVAQDNTEAAFMSIAQTTSRMSGTLDYGFEVSTAARAAVQGRTVAKDQGSLDRLGVWLGRRDDVPATQGIDQDAMAEVMGAHLLVHETPLKPDQITAVTDILNRVNDPAQWRRAERLLPKGAAQDLDRRSARELGLENAKPEQLPPTLRRLSRSVALANAIGDDALAADLRGGLMLYQERAREAIAQDKLQDLMPKPAVSSPVQASEPERFDYNIDRGVGEQDRRSPPARQYARARSGSTISFLDATSEVQVAKRVVRSILGANEPGFFSTLAQELRNPTLNKDNDMPLNAKHAQEFAPATADQHAIMGSMFGCKDAKGYSSDWKPEIAALGDGGTLDHGDLKKAVARFAQMAAEAGTIGPVSDQVPSEWKDNLLRLAKSGADMSGPTLGSAEQFEWAMKHAYRVGSVYSEAEELKTGVPRQDWASWKYMNAVTRMENWGDRNKLTKELSDWDDSVTDYMGQLSNVDVFSQEKSVSAFKELSLQEVRQIMNAENVPQEWKERFLDRAKNFEDPARHAKFASHAELEWNLKTIYQQGAKALTGKLPKKNDLAQDQELKRQMTKSKGFGLKPF